MMKLLTEGTSINVCVCVCVWANEWMNEWVYMKERRVSINRTQERRAYPQWAMDRALPIVAFYLGHTSHSISIRQPQSDGLVSIFSPHICLPFSIKYLLRWTNKRHKKVKMLSLSLSPYPSYILTVVLWYNALLLLVRIHIHFQMK